MLFLQVLAENIRVERTLFKALESLTIMWYNLLDSLKSKDYVDKSLLKTHVVCPQGLGYISYNGEALLEYNYFVRKLTEQ